jgi:hypothetical protein
MEIRHCLLDLAHRFRRISRADSRWNPSSMPKPMAVKKITASSFSVRRSRAHGHANPHAIEAGEPETRARRGNVAFARR